MNYSAIDYHKKNSFISTCNEQGERIAEAKICGNDPSAFARYFARLGEGPGKVVVEACWNWSWLHDVLSELEPIEEVVLAHPYKTRVIAEAQIKSDKLDARILSQLLRTKLIARAHVPSKQTRQRRLLLRQRMFWVRLRTMVRNRVHALLARQHGLTLPQRADLFGSGGMKFLRSVQLEGSEAKLLGQDLEVLEQLELQIKQSEKEIRRQMGQEPEVERLQSIPGVGILLSAVIAAEFDGAERFQSNTKLWAYCGLAPSTRSSDSHTWHGPLLLRCNKWLRWAFIEAAWIAIQHSAYFAAIYQRQLTRGKIPNKAIVVVARRLCEIAWKVLREKRSFSAQPPPRQANPFSRSPSRHSGGAYCKQYRLAPSLSIGDRESNPLPCG